MAIIKNDEEIISVSTNIGSFMMPSALPVCLFFTPAQWQLNDNDASMKWLFFRWNDSLLPIHHRIKSLFKYFICYRYHEKKFTQPRCQISQLLTFSSWLTLFTEHLKNKPYTGKVNTMTEISTRIEKISYGLGDMASHIVLDNVIIFLTF